MKRKLSLVVVLALLVSMFAVTAMADTTATVDLENGTYTVTVDATVGDVTYDKASVLVIKPGKATRINSTADTTQIKQIGGIYFPERLSNDFDGILDYMDVAEEATGGKFTFTKKYSDDEFYGTYNVYTGLFNATGSETQSTTSFYGDLLGATTSKLNSLTSGVGVSGETKFVRATAVFSEDKADYRVFIATYNAQGGIENIIVSVAPIVKDNGTYEIYTQLNNYSEDSTTYRVFLWDTANKNKPVTKVLAGTI